MKQLTHYDLTHHTTFGISARCARYVEYSDAAEACEAARMLAQEPAESRLVVGGGSNLLLTRDFDGLVVSPEARFDVAVEKRTADSVWLRAWAGTTMDELIAYAVDNHYYGAENLSLIPGQVGASAVQNVGAYGVEACDIIQSVEAIDLTTLELVTIEGADCGYGYRKSRFKSEWAGRYLITHVVYKLSLTFAPHLDYGGIRSALEAKGISQPTAHDLRQVIIDIRRAKLPDPAEQGNAGSFFMNPIVTRAQYEVLKAANPGMPHYVVDADHVKVPAGWMIDQCGWKGRSLSRAGVHDRQALVLVNRGGATGSEVVALCQAIQADVKAHFGVDLKPEVNII